MLILLTHLQITRNQSEENGKENEKDIRRRVYEYNNYFYGLGHSFFLKTIPVMIINGQASCENNNNYPPIHSLSIPVDG